MQTAPNSGIFIGTFTALNGGVSGGGVTSSIRIADDLRKVNRNDTETQYFREPDGDKWINAFRLGENIPANDTIWQSVYNFSWCYDVDICATNSDIGVMAKNGHLYITSNFFDSVTRLTTFKSGALDSGLSHYPHHAARAGGSYIRIDPVNPDRIAVGHPLDGGYISLDRGATAFTQPGTLPAPINYDISGFPGGSRIGVQWAFDRSSASGGSCQTVYALVGGRQVYRATTGLGGAWTGIGGPDICTALEARGGRLYVVGTPDLADGQLWVWNGTTWAQPTGITGRTVCTDPLDPLKVIVCTEGGAQHYSTDGGVNWITYSIAGEAVADDSPWLENTNLGYFGICTSQWEHHGAVNRLWVSTGLGVFYFDNPPRTALGQKYVSHNLGIKQMLLKNGVVKEDGTMFCVGEDRPIWRYPVGQWHVEAEGHGPNYDFPLRHGGDIDWWGNYIVAVYSPGSGGPQPNFAVSNDNGVNWVEGVQAQSDYFGDIAAPMIAGNLAVTGEGKFIWASSQGGQIKYTLNDGEDFDDPVFRHTPGGPIIDMTDAAWHHNFTFRRKILASDKSLEGHALAWCSGYRRDNYSLVYPDWQGVWETFDHGANWLRIRATVWLGAGPDAFHCKFKFIPGSSTNVFWATGSNHGPPDVVTGFPTVVMDQGLYFSTDKGATKTTITGFGEATDVTFSRNPSGGSMPRINVWGWRDLAGTVTLGLWTSDNFNAASPNAATWVYRCGPPEGRFDGDGNFTIAGHPNFWPVVITPPSGGFYVYDEESNVEPGKPYRIRAS